MTEIEFRARATRRPYAEQGANFQMREFDALVIEAPAAHAYPPDWPREGVDVRVIVRPRQSTEEKEK